MGCFGLTFSNCSSICEPLKSSLEVHPFFVTGFSARSRRFLCANRRRLRFLSPDPVRFFRSGFIRVPFHRYLHRASAKRFDVMFSFRPRSRPWLPGKAFVWPRSDRPFPLTPVIFIFPPFVVFISIGVVCPFRYDLFTLSFSVRSLWEEITSVSFCFLWRTPMVDPWPHPRSIDY